jgi:hypothetical protein
LASSDVLRRLGGGVEQVLQGAASEETGPDSRGRRSIATVAPTIINWGSNDPLSKGTNPESPGDGPPSVKLFNASVPASSRDMPYAATVRAAPGAARRRWTAVADRSKQASAIPAITNGIHVIVG